MNGDVILMARRISALVVVLALVLGVVPVFGASGTDIVRGILGTLINEAAKSSQKKTPQKSNTPPPNP